MGNSFVLFDVSILISHGQFHCGNIGHTQSTDFPWVKSHFSVAKGLVEPQLLSLFVLTARKITTIVCTVSVRELRFDYRLCCGKASLD